MQKSSPSRATYILCSMGIMSLIFACVASLQFAFVLKIPLASLSPLQFMMPIILANSVGIGLGSWLYLQKNQKVLLEAQVAQKTAALNQTNQELQQEIHKREQIAQDLVRAKDEAEEANRSKSEFLANISHEVRTPLNAMIGFTQMMRKTLHDEDFMETADEYLEYVEITGNHLSELLNQILNLSKINAGKMGLSLEAVSLKQVYRHLEKIYRVEAEKKGLSFKGYLDPNLPELISSDRTKLTQILTNLLSNAIKFTQQGQIGFEIHKEENTFLLKVQDQGMGIPLEDQARIFQAFEQVDNSTSKAFSGTGLGLAIAKELSGLFEGSISLESAPGQGSTFLVRLPLDPLQTPSAETQKHKARLPELKDGSVLVIEDNIINQKLIRAFLEKLGIQVQIAENGKEGIETLMQLHKSDTFPDLVLLDLHMPIMDGMETIHHIRHTHSWKDLPVVALTADAFQDKKDEALLKGFSDYLTKPLKMDTALELLKKYILPST